MAVVCKYEKRVCKSKWKDNESCKTKPSWKTKFFFWLNKLVSFTLSPFHDSSNAKKKTLILWTPPEGIKIRKKWNPENVLSFLRQMKWIRALKRKGSLLKQNRDLCFPCFYISTASNQVELKRLWYPLKRLFRHESSMKRRRRRGRVISWRKIWRPIWKFEGLTKHDCQTFYPIM